MTSKERVLTAFASEEPDRVPINSTGGHGDIINGNGMLRSMEQTLVDLITDDAAGLLLADRRMEINMGNIRWEEQLCI